MMHFLMAGALFLLSGTNLAKLAVNTFMIVGLWFLRTAVVNAISPEADKRAAWIRCLPVAVTLVLQAAFFFLTGPMPSTATWGEYHQFPFAAPHRVVLRRDRLGMLPVRTPDEAVLPDRIRHGRPGLRHQRHDDGPYGPGHPKPKLRWPFGRVPLRSRPRGHFCTVVCSH